MDRHNVRMVEARNDAGFLEVRLDICWASHPLRVGHLDRNGSVQFVVVGEINPPETALTQNPGDPVTTDPLRELLRRICPCQGGGWLANRHIVLIRVDRGWF